MDPLPDYGQDDYQGHGKLKDKVIVHLAFSSAQNIVTPCMAGAVVARGVS